MRPRLACSRANPERRAPLKEGGVPGHQAGAVVLGRLDGLEPGARRDLQGLLACWHRKNRETRRSGKPRHRVRQVLNLDLLWNFLQILLQIACGCT